jgi:selenium-binding protein 1
MSYPTMLPDPTFYPSPRLAADAPAEKLAYVVTISPGDVRPDALVVVDVDPQSASYGKVVGRVDMPHKGDELHHFGWNACSSALCPTNPHPHMERRYLVVPGLRSSRIHILDTKPNPRQPKLVRVIESAEVASKGGYSRPHTVHCGPEGIYVSAIGSPRARAPAACSCWTTTRST